MRKKLDKIEFAPTKGEALRRHGRLLDKLRTFAKERYDLDWSEDDADSALLGYLQESDPRPRRRDRRRPAAETRK